MKSYYYTTKRSWVPVYEGAEPVGGADAEAIAAEAAAAEAAKKSGKTFTQEQVDKIVQDRVKNTNIEKQKLVTDLEQLKKIKGLSDEEKTRLTAQIETLASSMMTKEELAATERKKLEKQSKEREDSLVADANKWKNLHTESTLSRSLTDAAVSAEAYRPSQIVAILRPLTSLSDELDKEGKPTGNLIPTVKFSTKDSKGNFVTLDMPIDQAMKLMKENTDEYGNLFKSGANGGFGGAANSGKRTNKLDAAQMSTKDYINARKKGELKLDEV